MFNFIFYNKKNLFLILGLTLIILILAIIRFSSPQAPEEEVLPIPLISPSPSPSFSAQDLPQTTPEEDIPYNLIALNRDYERIVSPRPLSLTDSEIRQALIDRLNNQSGILNTTAVYQIEYVKAPNSFMVEIKSATPDTAKSEALNWFKAQGLTTQGICNLPVVFYLSSEARDSLNQTDTKFNPIPEGCQ